MSPKTQTRPVNPQNRLQPKIWPPKPERNRCVQTQPKSRNRAESPAAIVRRCIMRVSFLPELAGRRRPGAFARRLLPHSPLRTHSSSEARSGRRVHARHHARLPERVGDLRGGASAAGGDRSRARPERAKARNASRPMHAPLEEGTRGAAKGGESGFFGAVFFRRAGVFEDALGEKAGVLSNGALDPVGDLRTGL